jgi:hypothetical protein
MEALTKALTSVDASISVVRTNPYIASAVTLFLILYASLAAPALPASLASLFEHGTFKLLVMILILYLVKNQDITTALLVAICLSVSLNTLSKYRVFNMANDLTMVGKSQGVGQFAETPQQSDASSSSQPDKPVDTSLGPNGVAAGSGDTHFQSNGTTHRTTLRGHEYTVTDEHNLLPGGHGSMIDNMSLNVSSPLLPEVKVPTGKGPTGYESGGYATIGGPDSQL